MIRRALLHWQAASTLGPDYNQYVPKPGDAAYSASLPTAEYYRKLTVEELAELLKKIYSQIAALRKIFENFHYEVEKAYRKQIFDYHDRAAQFSQAHGQMQMNSINHTREALIKMREQEEMEHRDLKIVYTLLSIATVLFWLYCRRHYINVKTLDNIENRVPYTSRRDIGNPFYYLSTKLSGRSRETSFEKEQREKAEQMRKEKGWNN